MYLLVDYTFTPLFEVFVAYSEQIVVTALMLRWRSTPGIYVLLERAGGWIGRDAAAVTSV